MENHQFAGKWARHFALYSIINSRISVNSFFAPFAPDRAVPRGIQGTPDWTMPGRRVTIRSSMSALFFKRFLKRPFQIASIVPSSKALVERVASKMDFTQARVIAEYGPGEGVHSREIARRMTADSHLLLFELDAALARALERQFAADRRVHVIHGDAASLPFELKRLGFTSCDYILSGIPFSILKIDKKRALLRKTYDALKPDG